MWRLSMYVDIENVRLRENPETTARICDYTQSDYVTHSRTLRTSIFEGSSNDEMRARFRNRARFDLPHSVQTRLQRVFPGLGAGGDVVTLAARKTFENRKAAFWIGIDQPPRERDDQIEIDGKFGTVQRLGFDVDLHARPRGHGGAERKRRGRAPWSPRPPVRGVSSIDINVTTRIISKARTRSRKCASDCSSACRTSSIVSAPSSRFRRSRFESATRPYEARLVRAKRHSVLSRARTVRSGERGTNRRSKGHSREQSVGRVREPVDVSVSREGATRASRGSQP